MSLPVRKKLPHTIPQWVAEGSWFFITIKCVPPGKNQLCRADTGDAVLAAMRFNHQKFVWHCRLCLLMLDHLARHPHLPAQAGYESGRIKLEKIRRDETRCEMAAGLLRSSVAQRSGTARQDELHPDESSSQRLVQTRGRLGVGLSSERSPTAAVVGLTPLRRYQYPAPGRARHSVRAALRALPSAFYNPQPSVSAPLL